MRRDGDETATGRYTVHEAAVLLGLSVDAVRKRAERGTLKREKGEDGTVYVLVDSNGHSSNGDETATGQRLVAVLEEQVEHLKRQLEAANDANRENRRIIAGLIERLPPQLEASQDLPPEASGGPQRPPEGGDRDEGKRPWWRRLFGE